MRVAGPGTQKWTITRVRKLNMQYYACSNSTDLILFFIIRSTFLRLCHISARRLHRPFRALLQYCAPLVSKKVSNGLCSIVLQKISGGWKVPFSFAFTCHSHKWSFLRGISSGRQRNSEGPRPRILPYIWGFQEIVKSVKIWFTVFLL